MNARSLPHASIHGSMDPRHQTSRAGRVILQINETKYNYLFVLTIFFPFHLCVFIRCIEDMPRDELHKFDEDGSDLFNIAKKRKIIIVIMIMYLCKNCNYFIPDDLSQHVYMHGVHTHTHEHTTTSALYFNNRKKCNLTTEIQWLHYMTPCKRVYLYS